MRVPSSFGGVHLPPRSIRALRRSISSRRKGESLERLPPTRFFNGSESSVLDTEIPYRRSFRFATSSFAPPKTLCSQSCERSGGDRHFQPLPLLVGGKSVCPLRFQGSETIRRDVKKITSNQAGIDERATHRNLFDFYAPPLHTWFWSFFAMASYFLTHDQTN